MRTGALALLASFILYQAGTAALADPSDPIPTYIPARPSEDGMALAAIAPPSNRATARLAYGDAAFAHRSRVVRLWSRRDAAVDETVLRTTPCPAHTARATFRQCDRVASAFFRKTYVLTPTYVSAPQIFDQSPRRPSPTTSPIAAFFYDPITALPDR